MSFLLATRIPKENQELHRGTPIIVDGFQWCLVAKLVQYQPYIIEAHVECMKVDEPVLYTSKVSLLYQGDTLNQVDLLDTSQQLKSNVRQFSVNEIFKSGDYFMSVSVNMNQISRYTNRVDEQTTGATKTCADLENQIIELKKVNEENLSKIDGKYEEKCAKLKDMVRKLEERLNVAEEYDKLEKETETLTYELENMKVSESEASLKNELEHLKAELEVANQKVMHAETKVELMQRIVEETEADLNEKNKELELAKKAEEHAVNDMIYNMGVVHKKLESTVKEKDEKIALLQGYCKNYQKETNILHSQLRESKKGNEHSEQREAENERLIQQVEKLEEECGKLKSSNEWLEQRNKILSMTEEEKHQHAEEMRGKIQQKERELLVGRRQCDEDWEKVMKKLNSVPRESGGTVAMSKSTVEEAEAERRFVGRLAQIGNALEEAQIQLVTEKKVRVKKEQDTLRKTMAEQEFLLCQQLEIERDQKEMDKKWDEFFKKYEGHVSYTDVALEERDMLNRHEEKIEARRKDIAKKLEKQAKKLKFAASAFQEPNGLDNNYE